MLAVAFHSQNQQGSRSGREAIHREIDFVADLIQDLIQMLRRTGACLGTFPCCFM
jgi:hypothetical protein